MISLFAPPFLYLFAALLCPLLSSGKRAKLLLIVPVLGLISLLGYSTGNHVVVNVLGFELTFVRLDKLSQIFGIIFSIAAFLAGIYAWHVRDKVQQIATLLYAGARWCFSR